MITADKNLGFCEYHFEEGSKCIINGCGKYQEKRVYPFTCDDKVHKDMMAFQERPEVIYFV
jgi:hypothetical protein